MPDTELQGVIKLTADTAEAEKKVDALDDKTASKAAGQAAQSLDEIGGKLRAIFRDIGSLGGGVFGGIARSMDDMVSRVQRATGGKSGIAGIIGAGIKESLDTAIRSGMPNMPRPGSYLSAFQSPSWAPGSGGIQKPGGLAGVMNAMGMVGKGGGAQLPAWASGLFGNAAGGAGKVAGVAAAAGGGAGGGGAAAGGVAAAGGAAGGAAGLAASLGPIGIAVAAVGASLAIYAGLAYALKEVTGRVLDFGRSLAAASPSIAQLFAVFDVQIMLMKRQVGEALAPAFASLLRHLTSLAIQVLPAFTAAMEFVITLLDVIIQQIQEWVVNTKTELGIAKGGAEIMAGNPIAGIADIANAFKDYVSWKKQQANNKAMAIPNVMQNYMDMLNKQGSDQRNYRDRQRGQPVAAPAPSQGASVRAGVRVGARGMGP